MLDKIKNIRAKYDQLNQKLSDPAVISDQASYRKLAKERSDLETAFDLGNEYAKIHAQIAEAKSIVADGTDKELMAMAQDELAELEPKLEQLAKKLTVELLPKDPLEGKNIYLEIRGGTGGEEAALFAGDLLRMYTRYAEKKGWKVELVDENATELGGYKEVILSLSGRDVYRQLKFESGVHRVQRVPKTEAGGRIHTSAATVAVVPQAEDVDIKIEEKDLRIDTYRSSGPGGQNVNKTSSAIRITYLPTGLAVACQQERSQLQNRIKAMALLRARLLDEKIRAQQEALTKDRRAQVGSGDRSEKIRTYNFPQSRVTDHRIKLTVHQLEDVLDGNLDTLIQPLIEEEQAKLLAQAAKDMVAGAA